MTCREQEDDLAPDEASGVLCRCGHLLTDSDLHFCGYCGSVIQVTSGRRQAPAAVVSGRRAALAALASERDAVPAERNAVPAERNAVPAEPVTDRFVAPAVRALHPVPPPVTTPPVTTPPVTTPAAPAPTASAALAAAGLAAAAETARAATTAAPVASATRAARAAKAARMPRANKPARVARGVGVTTTPSAPGSTPAPASAAPVQAAALAPAPAQAPAAEPDADTSSPPATAPPAAAVPAATPPPPGAPTSAPPTEAPGDGPVPSGRATPPTTARAVETDEADEGGEPEAAVAPPATVLGRRNWTALLAVLVIVGACAVRTALGLLFTYPGYLSWLPVVLVAALALVKVARFSIGLVGCATAAVTVWWAVDHVVSTARLQALGYDIGQSTISVPGLVAAVGSVPLAVVVCVLLDRRTRRAVRSWVVPRGGFDAVRAAAVVLALLAALFPVVGSLATGPGFAVLTAARDQVRYPGYPAPGEIADRMHAMSVSKGRPVSMTCTYAPDDGAARPSYQCVGISQVGSEAAQVHDGIRSTVLPDGTYSCVDLTSGVDRRLC